MKEVVYKYSNRGMYVTEDDTCFGGEKQIKIIAEPHDFSLTLGGELLRKSFCEGMVAIVSDSGEVVFMDNGNNIIARADKTDKTFEAAKFYWDQEYISILFGKTELVDHYPNCDGESDRWSEKWVTARSVKLNLKDSSVETE